MFTGIIEALGKISRLQKNEDGVCLFVDAGMLDIADVAVGDSIAVNGACLTVVSLDRNSFSADVSMETLRCTTLDDLKAGSSVNLEKALLASARLGGHIVSGHVDGVGKMLGMEPEGNSWKIEFEAPDELARYIAGKGSICVDGTSLTVNDVKGARFTVNIIPHTRDNTIMQFYHTGSRVNLEVDLVSRYLERLLLGDRAAQDKKTDSGITMDLLRSHGFGNGD